MRVIRTQSYDCVKHVLNGGGTDSRSPLCGRSCPPLTSTPRPRAYGFLPVVSSSLGLRIGERRGIDEHLHRAAVVLHGYLDGARAARVGASSVIDDLKARDAPEVPLVRS